MNFEMLANEPKPGNSQRTEKSQPLLIFPCNGSAMEAVDCIGPEFDFKGFIDDTAEKQRVGALGHAVHSRIALEEQSSCQILAVPGSPTSYSSRKNLIESLRINASRFARVIHPAAQVSSNATIGYNFLAMAGVVVTSNAVIGNHVCLLPNTVVHHDSIIGDWSLIGANVAIAGGVDVGENCFIGSGASIKNGVRIGNRALIGLGSTVIHDVPDNAVVAGSPARILR